MELVCGISSGGELRVTSSPPHFETDPWWQLLGENRDVSIRLSKEIAWGSSRSLRANQTLHAVPTEARSAPNCRGVNGKRERKEGARLGCWALQSVRTNSPSWGLGLICMARTRQNGYFYKAFAQLFTSLSKLLKRRRQPHDFRKVFFLLHKINLSNLVW